MTWGRPVEEIVTWITPQQFESYQAYFALEPTGSIADDFRTAMICQSAVGAMAGKNTPPLKSFLPQWDTPPQIPFSQAAEIISVFFELKDT